MSSGSFLTQPSCPPQPPAPTRPDGVVVGTDEMLADAETSFSAFALGHWF